MKLINKVLFAVIIVSFLLLLPHNKCQAAEGVTTVSQGDAVSEETVAVKELDMGDYLNIMAVGDKQLLYVTVLPTSATEKEIVYFSSNVEVASINSMGRITAIKEGTTTITAQCGGKTGSFELTIKQSLDETEKIPVQGIELSELEDTLAVDKMMQINATVLPAEATDAKLTYTTSNEGIATVKSNGQVKGIAPGNVTITVQAGEVKKEIPLTIKIATTTIRLESEYVVLKVGETFPLNAKVLPEGADQMVRYETNDENIAAVSGNGVITAKQTGTAMIKVSNEDMDKAVTVIVNMDMTAQEEVLPLTTGGSNIPDYEEALIAGLNKSQSVITDSKQNNSLSKELLNYLYLNRKTVIVDNNNYSISIEGENIKNSGNVLYTDLNLETLQDRIAFTLNKGKALPGMVTVRIADVEDMKYLYLYNEYKGKYEQISFKNIGELQLDIPGRYLLTTDKMANFNVNLLFMGILVIVLVIVGGIWLLQKKKYWFW